ncbi:MAG: glucose 1-dehydrogenase [Caldilineaceae bacterium]|nr:glucose 1-dehydrogenase [Caldilineaceae bacterium]MBP8123427.1 glucose 1-dehydrogenase [Caldilineaceae bacterium]
MKRFAEKVAIVTGAGQGIGKGIAQRLADEGTTVVIAEFNPETAAAAAKEIEQGGGRALAYPIDIADVAAVQRMVHGVVAQLGHIDILVNNAGVVQTKPMMDLSEADWDRVITINQRGAFFCLQAVAEQMIAQLPESIRKAAEKPADIMSIHADSPVVEMTDGQMSFGKIVNLSSVSGRRGRPLSTHYAASKAAIISITQSAALALAPYRINVNAICPGIVPTPMWRQIDVDRGKLFGAQPGEAMNAFINTIPLKRAGTAADIGGAVAFFCSTDADYVTGQALNVDGGYEMD